VRQRGGQRDGIGLEGCNLPGRLWLLPAGDWPHLLSAGPVVFAAVSCHWALLGWPGGRRLWRCECRGPCGRVSESRRPWVVTASCGAASAEAHVGVHPSRSCHGLIAASCGASSVEAPVGVHPSRAGLGLMAASCGVATVEAPVGMHPSRSGLGLIAASECLDWLVLATPVSVAVPTSDALCLFLG
jgi:hypothetical protein